MVMKSLLLTKEAVLKVNSMHKKRLLIGLLLGPFVFVVLFMGVYCIRPAFFGNTNSPRPDHPLQSVAVVYSDNYDISFFGLEQLHSFDIRKYAKIYAELQSQGYLRRQDVFVPEPLTQEQILLVHSQDFLESLGNPQRVAEYLELEPVGMLPAKAIDANLLSAFRWSSGGTVEAARLALKYGIGINIGGGYHHAKPHAGEGFCIYNDLAIAIRLLQRDQLIQRACVIDLDVHQGNGTALIFANDDTVFTFSMHQADIYPIPKESSDWDIELPAGTDDSTFMKILSQTLPDLLRQADPDIVFLQAGCDTLADDPLASLSMTPAGIIRRDQMVIDACVQRNIPLVMTLGGGYSPQAWQVQYASIARTLDRYGLAGAVSRNLDSASSAE